MYGRVEGNRLYLPTGGGGGGGGGGTGVPKRDPNIVARLTEPAPADYREVAISRGARGDYYASSVSEQPDAPRKEGGVLAPDRGIKTLATGVNEPGRVYPIGGYNGHQRYNRHLDNIRSKRDRCQKKPRRYIHSRRVCQRVSERKRAAQRDCLHKAAHLIAHRLVESTVVIGDRSQRRMVPKAHQRKRRSLHRAVFNGWGLYGFVSMLDYKGRRAGNELHRIDERYTARECSRCGHRQPMPLCKRTYRCGTGGRAMERDATSAVDILRRFLARLGPHTSLC
jgi:putative transposase